MRSEFFQRFSADPQSHMEFHQLDVKDEMRKLGIFLSNSSSRNFVQFIDPAKTLANTGVAAKWRKTL